MFRRGCRVCKNFVCRMTDPLIQLLAIGGLLFLRLALTLVLPVLSALFAGVIVVISAAQVWFLLIAGRAYRKNLFEFESARQKFWQ